MNLQTGKYSTLDIAQRMIEILLSTPFFLENWRANDFYFELYFYFSLPYYVLHHAKTARRRSLLRLTIQLQFSVSYPFTDKYRLQDS